MSTSPLTQNRQTFTASFQGDGPEAKKRNEAKQRLTTATGMPPDGVEWLIRLYDSVTTLRDGLNFQPETHAKFDAYATTWSAILAGGNPDNGLCVHWITVALDLLPDMFNALNRLESVTTGLHDRVRLLSACTKSLCAVATAMEKPNSLLAPRITASTNSLYGLIDKFGDQLAAEKLKHSGTDTKPSDMEDARNALKGGGRAIGYHIDHKTGKVTFVELEIRDSLFGVGGRPAPKRGDDNKAHWLAAIPFAQSFTGSSAQPVLLTHLHAPFQDWSALPQPVKEFSGVSNLHVHQQQQFLDELNRKWPQWEEDYKKVHAGDVTDDINVLAGKIIARENVKQAITEIVAAAAAVKEPPPPQPSPT